jgi:hypothetical protein
MTEMTHERCSELLLSYERGELDAPQASEVEAHLAKCVECSLEQTGVAVLLAGEPGALTAAERVQLHEAVSAAIAADKPGATDTGPRRSLWERLWPGLQIAAVAVVVLIAFVFVLPNVFQGSDDGGLGNGDTGGTDDRAQTAEGGSAFAAPEGPGPVFGESFTVAESEARQQDTAAEPPPEGPAQAFEEIPVRQATAPYTQKEVRAIGYQDVFATLAAAYTAEDAQLYGENFLDQLATAAPDETIAEAVRQCGTEILETSGHSVLPAYAAYNLVAKEESLILGFLSADSPSEPLHRYQIWVWTGIDCEAPPSYSAIGDVARPNE